jgi:hypothetical protein
MGDRLDPRPDTARYSVHRASACGPLFWVRLRMLVCSHDDRVDEDVFDFGSHSRDTTTLIAALNMATGEVIVQCHPRHRHQEFASLVSYIDKAGTATLDGHLLWITTT